MRINSSLFSIPPVDASCLLGPTSDNGSELMTRANREQLGIYSREGTWRQCDVARTFVKAILGHPSDLQHIGFGFATPAVTPWRHNKTKQSRTQHPIETRGKTQYAFRSWLACFFGVYSSILFSFSHPPTQLFLFYLWFSSPMGYELIWIPGKQPLREYLSD